MNDNSEIITLIAGALSRTPEAFPGQLYDFLDELTAPDAEIPDLDIFIGCFYGSKPLSPEAWALWFSLLEIFARNGDTNAMNELGVLYYEGEGCTRNYAKAILYYQLAADNGNTHAQENLGYCYYYGRSVPADYEKAFHYFAMGAFAGRMTSLYKVGDMYLNGYHVPRNEAEAFAIYDRCLALMTDEDAPENAGPVFLRLGDCFLKGIGTEPDYKKALTCYQKAESYLYDMVKEGNARYRGSLNRAVSGQDAARKKLAETLD